MKTETADASRLSGREAPGTLTFVVPALNEESGLERTIKVINGAARRAGLGCEIVVVDDGSTDKTCEVASRLAEGQANLRVVRHERNRGLGAAYKSGVAAARMSHVILIPGDDAWPEDALVQILGKLGQADIVIPYIEEAGDKSAFRRLLSRTYTAGVNALFGLHVPYYNGIVLHRTDLVRSVTITADDFSYQTEALVKLLRRGCSFVTVGTHTNARPGGESKALAPNNVRRVLSSVLRLFFRVRLLGETSGS